MITPYRIRNPLIQIMTDEHVVIMRALEVLNAVAMSMSTKHTPPVSDLKLLIRFFKEYADRIHHHSEEDILFVALEKSRSRTMRRMLEKLGTQHVIGRMLVAQMTEALTGATPVIYPFIVNDPGEAAQAFFAGNAGGFLQETRAQPAVLRGSFAFTADRQRLSVDVHLADDGGVLQLRNGQVG